jgi:hypothetical protein
VRLGCCELPYPCSLLILYFAVHAFPPILQSADPREDSPAPAGWSGTLCHQLWSAHRPIGQPLVADRKGTALPSAGHSAFGGWASICVGFRAWKHAFPA